MKNYILKDTEFTQDTHGTFCMLPKVIMQGDKYRNELDSDEKLIYAVMLDYARKAQHKNQVDEHGRVYVNLSHSMIVLTTGIGVDKVKRKLKTSDKSLALFRLGLIQYKGRGKGRENCYYVMLPEFQAEDEFYKFTEKPTTSARKEMKDMVDKKKQANKDYIEKKQLEKINQKAENVVAISYVKTPNDYGLSETHDSMNAQLTEWDQNSRELSYYQGKCNSIAKAIGECFKLMSDNDERKHYVELLDTESSKIFGKGRKSKNALVSESKLVKKMYFYSEQLLQEIATKYEIKLINDKTKVIEIKYMV